ncbi:Fat-like cadherin-related tumor suppressor, partial [Araneus ventricosus]
PCTSSPCLNKGNCTVNGNSFKCACKGPFFGNRCEKDPCSSSPCRNGGKCKITGNTYSCDCPKDYVGERCEHGCDCKNGRCRVTSDEEVLCECLPEYGKKEEVCEPCDCGTGANCTWESGIFFGYTKLRQRFQDDGNVSRCYSTGRPRVTTPNEDRYLAVTAKRNRRSTASDLSRQLSSATGTTVSRQTVYRRLGHIGLYARRPVRCVPHTATHCRLRLAWSREHALGTPQQWSCVMFSDESRFSLQSDSRRIFIWRAPGTRYHQENTIERHRYGGAGWLVWGGIILGSRTDLHVQSVTMTGHIYRDVILEQHVRLFRGAMGVEFLFMDDNARPHRANIVDECLQS